MDTVVILPAKKDELKEFSIREWHGVNEEHYGRDVEWNFKEFVFKAMENGTVVGMISGKHESGVLYTEDIIVGKEKRHTGIGKALMKAAEEFGKSQGAHKAYLLTGKTWKATKFYESLRYEQCGDLPDHHFHTDFVAYSKKL